MKMKKAVGPDRVPVRWTILNLSIEWLKDLFSKVLVEGIMPDDWRELLYQYLKTEETYKNVGTI